MPTAFTMLAASGGTRNQIKITYKDKKRMNPKVDIYISKSKKWQEELEKLRMIILDCQLLK